MKRIFLIVIGLYLVIGTILIFTVKDKPNVINFFTLKQNYSRLLSEDESLVVSLFIDENDSFITDETNVVGASLKNEENVLAVRIMSFEEVDEMIEYNGKNYYLFNVTIDLNEVNVSDFDLKIRDCYLVLDYLNSESFEIYLGDVFISFGEVFASNYLDYFNMYGIINKIEGENYLLAIMIKFENLSNLPITITDISSVNDKISFDLLNHYLSPEKIDGSVNIANFLGEYDHLEEKEQGMFALEDEYYYLIPLVYESLEKIYRLPITIEYIYNDETYTLELDDYLFFDESINLNEHPDDIREYQYFYPESN